MHEVFVTESILLISSVGMQINEDYALGRRKSRFIPWTNIKDVFINEIIQLVRKKKRLRNEDLQIFFFTF